MQKPYINRYNSFKHSLSSLKEAKGKDKNDSFVLSGTAMKFNLTFDLAWKLMSDIIKEEHKIVDEYIEVLNKFDKKVDEIIKNN